MKRRVDVCGALALLLAAAGPALADEPLTVEMAAAAAAAPASLAQELRKGFYSRINLLGYGIYNDRDGALAWPRDQAALEFRPDFGFTVRQFEFGIKPRLTYTHSNDGQQDSDGRHWFINEAYLRYRASDRVLLIYSRENLQWGPSALLSPSNPFNASNGKNNPNLELPGLDFVRVVVIPSSALTLSLIANTGAGRLGKDQTADPASQLASAAPFKKTYAVKADYTGDGQYVSLLASHRQQGDNRLGLFGGWNASDALLLYGEGGLGKKQREAPRDIKLLLGGAYTLETGAAITVEYFHNNSGCDSSPVQRCLAAPPPDLRLPLLRRRYALLQYVDTKIGGNLNLAARLSRNIDDQSSQLTVNLEYELGSHWQAYLVPALSTGKDGSEFGSLPRSAVFFGASYTF